MLSLWIILEFFLYMFHLFACFTWVSHTFWLPWVHFIHNLHAMCFVHDASMVFSSYAIVNCLCKGFVSLNRNFFAKDKWFGKLAWNVNVHQHSSSINPRYLIPHNKSLLIFFYIIVHDNCYCFWCHKWLFFHFFCIFWWIQVIFFWIRPTSDYKCSYPIILI